MYNMDYKKKYLKYQKKYNNLKVGSEPIGPKDLNQNYKQFKQLKIILVLYYRPDDHKYIIYLEN